MSDNHVFDCNSIQSLRIQGTQLLQTAGEVCRAWDDELLVIEGLLAAIPGDLRSPLLAESLDAFTHPLYRPELDDACCELRDTLTNLEANIPFIDHQAALTLDSLGEGMYSIITRANELTEEVAASYRKPELASGSSEALTAEYEEAFNKACELTGREAMSEFFRIYPGMENDLLEIDAAALNAELAYTEYANASYTDPTHVRKYVHQYQQAYAHMERLEKEFCEKYHLSADEYEAIQTRYAKAKEQDYIEGDIFGGLLTEFISAPLMVAEGIRNQVRAWSGKETDYYFVEARNEIREQVTAGMGTVGKTIYYGVADITSGLTLTLFTGANPWLMAVAMGLTTSDEVQMSKEQAGVDPKKAAGTAALSGALDAALRRFVFWKIDINRNITKGVQKSLSKQLGSAFRQGAEAAVISDLGYQTIDILMNGNLSDIGICYTAYLDEGLSEEEAWSKTENDLAEREFWNATTGGLLAAGYTTIQLLSHGVKMKKPPKRDDYDDFPKVQNAAGSAGDERGSKATGNIAKNLDTNNIPNMTKQEIIDAIPDNWKYTEHNGFVHIKDEAGKIRIRIDPSDKVTQYPHVHVYDNDGNLLDSLGNIVDRKSPDGHIPYKN